MKATEKNLKAGMTLKRNGHTIQILEVYRGVDSFVTYKKDGKKITLGGFEFWDLYLS